MHRGLQSGCSLGCIHICSCGTHAAAATAAETSKTIITLWPSCCLGFSLMQITFPKSELTLLSGEGNILRDCNVLQLSVTVTHQALTALCQLGLSGIKWQV